jgi:hypothetical protein
LTNNIYYLVISCMVSMLQLPSLGCLSQYLHHRTEEHSWRTYTTFVHCLILLNLENHMSVLDIAVLAVREVGVEQVKL